MATASDAIWAVDLGNNSLKALHMVAVGDAVQVIGFDHIPHGKLLSSSGVSAAEKDELIAITLRQFVQRNDVSYDPLIVSVPSQNSFARFVTLPPVEQKRLPEIVKFEAAQQIPFDMSEVQWDYQMMTEADSPEQKVGIFAIKNEIVEAEMEHFEREDLLVSYVQMAPMALYNYMLYDRPELVRSDNRATVIVNVGAESTDLVVCTNSAVWQRCIMMGGNTFTQAIAETCKLNFAKAEKLKRTAPVSKYARQIFQAMRPVFTDWAGEVQRSLGFYTNSNPDVKLARVIAMGGGTKLRGLLKYLQQTLQIPVEKPDAFKKLAIAQGLSTAKFHENVADFGVVYGLGLQGLGLARIESNLLPTSAARSMAWANKTKYFIGAAVMLLVVSLMCLGRVGLDRVAYARNEAKRSAAKRVVNRAEETREIKSDFLNQETELQEKMKAEFEVFRYRDVVPQLYELILSAMPNARNNPAQAALYEAYVRGDVARVKEVPRDQRKQIFVTNVAIFFSDDLATAQFGQTAMMRKDAVMRESQMAVGVEEDYEMLAQLAEIYGDRYAGLTGMTSEEEKDPGFVVSVVGYSPYRDLMALLDPTGVESRPDQWGLVTRLAHLDEFVDANSPFELYSNEADHFRIEKGAVNLDEDIPIGIGDSEYIPEESGTRTTGGSRMPTMMSYNQGLEILVDPVTRERIDAEPETDLYGNPKRDALGKPILTVRDSWFQLDFKLKWEHAPEIPQTTGLAGRR
ncbi:MAG: type IV pilus assembly protein PilM [Phycisphaerales bacterium]|nr:MAG: type IV pilus assembly protein PilM [Phycisphaerales bacterium]